MIPILACSSPNTSGASRRACTLNGVTPIEEEHFEYAGGDGFGARRGGSSVVDGDAEVARKFRTVGLILLCGFRVIERVLMCFEFGRGLVADC